MHTVTERLFVTADRERIVPETSSEAAFLLATPGTKLSDEDAAKYGLTTATPEPVDSSDDEDVKAEDVSENKAESVDDNKADDDEDGFPCDECDFVAKSAGGLTRHQKTP